MNSIAVLGLVGAGYGVGFVIGSMQGLGREDVAFIPIENEAPKLPSALVYRATGMSPLLSSLVGFVQANSSEN